jgi:hypothetical protein
VYFRKYDNIAIGITYVTFREETANPISTLNKKEQYNITVDTKKEKEKKNIGFRIDIRLNYNKNTQQSSCIDLCAGKTAKEEYRSKTMTNQCKVV